MDILYTKKDFLDIFSTMGIDEGMVVLVQADLTGFNEILSGSQAIIEALQESIFRGRKLSYANCGRFLLRKFPEQLNTAFPRIYICVYSAQAERFALD